MSVVDVTSCRDQLLAAGGQDITGRQPLEEPQTESLLESADTSEHRRMIDAETARRAGKRPSISDRENIAKVIPLESGDEVKLKKKIELKKNRKYKRKRKEEREDRKYRSKKEEKKRNKKE